MEEKYWDVLDKANLVDKILCQGKNDYETGDILYGLFSAPKVKYCFTLYKLGIVQERKIFKGFNDRKRLIDHSYYFEMIEGKKISALLPKSRKKSFDSGTNLPTKMRFCNECDDRKTCNKSNEQINENKEFEANLNELKRHPPYEFGHMLPHSKIYFATFSTKSSFI